MSEGKRKQEAELSGKDDQPIQFIVYPSRQARPSMRLRS
jgi:hypothetical protein